MYNNPFEHIYPKVKAYRDEAKIVLVSCKDTAYGSIDIRLEWFPARGLPYSVSVRRFGDRSESTFNFDTLEEATRKYVEEL